MTVADAMPSCETKDLIFKMLLTFNEFLVLYCPMPCLPAKVGRVRSPRVRRGRVTEPLAPASGYRPLIEYLIGVLSMFLTPRVLPNGRASDTQTRSTSKAIPMPPLMQSVASPRFAWRFPIS